MCLRGICGQRRPWSDCAKAQSGQGLRCPFKEISFDTTIMLYMKCPYQIVRLSRLIWTLTVRIYREGTFSHGVAHIIPSYILKWMLELYICWMNIAVCRHSCTNNGETFFFIFIFWLNPAESGSRWWHFGYQGLKYKATINQNVLAPILREIIWAQFVKVSFA